MSAEAYAVVLVASTSHALKLEKALASHGLTSKLIPVPRQISSDCGVCVRILQTDVAKARRAIEAAGITVEGIYPLPSP